MVNIAQIFNRSGMMLTCKKASGVTTPKDFKGKTLGVWFREAVERQDCVRLLRWHKLEAEAQLLGAAEHHGAIIPVQFRTTARSDISQARFVGNRTRAPVRRWRCIAR